MPWVRLDGDQLAVAEHARNKQPRREQADLPIKHEVQILVGQGP